MKEQGFDPLAQAIEQLAPEIAPEHDLWPGIAAKIEIESRVDRDRSAGPWWRQAVAALFFFALGAGAMGLYSGIFNSSDPPAGSIEAVAVSPGNVAEPGSPDSAGDPRMTSAQAGGQAVPVALGVETDYLRARDAIWLYLLDHRGSLPAGTIKVVEKNIEIIDRAIEEIRIALHQDPGNPELERRLMHHHQRSIDILRRVANVV